LKEASGDADVVVVVHSIIEVMVVKNKGFDVIETTIFEHFLFLSKTSNLSSTKMTSFTKQLGRFIGTHFQSVPAEKLWEVTTAYETCEEPLWAAV